MSMASSSETPLFNDEQQREAFVALFDGSPAPRRRRKRARIAKSALWKTPSGWRLRYPEHKADGRWIRPTVLLGTFRTRAKAEAEALRFLEARSVAPGTSPPWAEFSARYLRECMPRMRRESQATTRSVIARHIDPQFGELCLHEVGARIQAWVDEMRDADPPVPLSSMKHRVGVLRTMLAEAQASGLVVFIPARLKWPKAHRVRRAPSSLTFTADEQRTVLAAAGFPLKAALALGFYAGLRPSETAGLDWRLCDCKGRRLIIAQQRARHGEVTLPKTKSSEGSIAMVPELALILERYYRYLRKRDFAASPHYLFPNRAGRPLSASTLRVRHLYPLLEGLGLPLRGLHACRHAFADRLLESGARIDLIKAALRHSSLQATERYLSKAQPAEVVAAITKAAALGSAVGEITEQG